MSKLYEALSKPVMASINNGPPQTVIQHIFAYKFNQEGDLQDFIADFAEGMEILAPLEIDDVNYLVCRTIKPSKIQVSGELKK